MSSEERSVRYNRPAGRRSGIHCFLRCHLEADYLGPGRQSARTFPAVRLTIFSLLPFPRSALLRRSAEPAQDRSGQAG